MTCGGQEELRACVMVVCAHIYSSALQAVSSVQIIDMFHGAVERSNMDAATARQQRAALDSELTSYIARTKEQHEASSAHFKHGVERGIADIEVLLDEIDEVLSALYAPHACTHRHRR